MWLMESILKGFNTLMSSFNYEMLLTLQDCLWTVVDFLKIKKNPGRIFQKLYYLIHDLKDDKK